MIQYFFLLILNMVTCLTCSADEQEFKNLCVKTTCMEQYNALKTIDSSNNELGTIPTKFSVNATYEKEIIKLHVSYNSSKDLKAGLLSSYGSCMYLGFYKIYSFKSDYTEYQIESGFPIQFSFISTGEREIRFEFGKRLLDAWIFNDNSKFNFTTYYGYFNLQFELSDLVLLALRIKYKITTNALTQQQVESVADLQLIKDDSNCNENNECISLVSSTLKLCADSNCGSYIDQPKLVLNEPIYIKQILESSQTNFASAHFDSPIIIFKGQNLTREIPVTSTNVLQDEGAIIIEFKLDFVYSSTYFVLLVDSLFLINSQQIPLTQHLEPAHSRAVYQFPTETTCIYSDITTSLCPSCADMEKYSTLNVACIAEKLGCASDESVENGACLKESCKKYQEKLQSMTITDLSCIIDINGDDLTVIFSFTDSLDGLMQKDNDKSCITYKLFRYNSLFYTDGYEDNNLIYSIFNLTTNKRKWTFQIKQDDFLTTLNLDNSTDQTKYYGHYGYQFYYNEEVLLIYYFNFNFEIHNISNSGNKISLSGPFAFYNKPSCNKAQKCISAATTSLMICENLNCTSEAQEFIIGDNIYIMQTITHDGFLDWGLDPMQIEFIASGFLRVFDTVKVVVSEKGKIIMKIIPNFAYSKQLKLVVNSYLIQLTNNQISQSTHVLAIQESQTFCIKTNSDSTCESPIDEPEENQHESEENQHKSEEHVTEEDNQQLNDNSFELKMYVVYVPFMVWGVLSIIILCSCKKLEKEKIS